jgi:hypothetical protein
MTVYRTALLIRLVALLAGVGLVLLPVHPSPPGAIITGIGVLAAVLAPAQAGAMVATAAFVITWIAGTGLHTTPDLARTVLAAVALYVLHQSTALAAFVPLGSAVDGAVVRRWALRSRIPLAVAALVIAVDEIVPRSDGSALVELVGLVGVLVVIGVATRVVWTSSDKANQLE